MTAIDVFIHAGVVTLLAVSVWLLTRLWRNPHAGRVLWLAVLLKLVCPPLWAVDYEPAAQPPPSPVRQTGAALDVELFEEIEPPRVVPAKPIGPAERIAPSQSVDATLGKRPHPRERPLPDGRGSKPAAPAAPVDFMTLSAVVWACGTLLVWLSAAVRSLRFVRSVRRLPDGDERLTELLDRAAARLNVRAPQLKISDGVGPLLRAVPGRRATVVVPSALFDALPDDRAEALFAHECAHLRRRDHWVRWLELCVCGLWWWLPTAWLAAAAGRRCEELCCDAAVLAAGDSPGDHAAAYAEGLLAAAEYLSKAKRPPIPLPASGVGRSPFLKRRFEMILSDRLPRRPGRGVRTLLGGLAAGAVLVGVTFAQPPGEPDAVPDALAADTPPLDVPSPDESGGDETRGDEAESGDDEPTLPTLAGAVETFNRTAAGRADPVTLEQAAAAIRRKFAEWPSPTVTKHYNWALSGDEPPAGGWVRIVRSDIPGAQGRYVDMNAPAAGTAFQIRIPDGAPAPLEEAVAAYNATAEGRANPVTFEQVAEAVRNAMGDGGTRRRFAWVFGTGEPPPEAKILVAPGTFPGRTDEFPNVTISNSDEEYAIEATIKRSALSAATRAKIAAALAAAADDPGLPVATRLKLLRESVEPGELSPERNAQLFAEFVAGMRREREVLRQSFVARAGLGGDEPTDEQVAPLGSFRAAKTPLIETMAVLEAAAPDKDAAYFVALLGAQWRDPGLDSSGRHSLYENAVHVLNRTAGSAAGLRALLGAAETPAPELPKGVPLKPPTEVSLAEMQRLSQRVEYFHEQLRETVADHHAAIDLLLKTVRSARPATDAAADVLLDTAGSDDPALRAAAIEALAGSH